MSILCDVALSGHFVVYNLVLRDRRRKLCGFSSVWQAWHFAHAAKTLAGVAHMRGGFGGHLTRQAQYLVNLGDVLKGSKASFCETVVELIWGMMMIQCGRCGTSDASGSFFMAGAVLCRPRPKKPEI